MGYWFLSYKKEFEEENIILGCWKKNLKKDVHGKACAGKYWGMMEKSMCGILYTIMRMEMKIPYGKILLR